MGSIGTTLARTQLLGDFQAIVVGSGLAGLGTAVFLAKAGWRVLVLEQHYTAGGMLHTFRRGRYDWNTGCHYIGQMRTEQHLVRQSFDYVTGGGLAWTHMADNYDRLEFPGMNFEFVRGASSLRSALIAAFPHERVGIEKYIGVLEKMSRDTARFSVGRLLPGRLGLMFDKTFARGFMRHARSTTAEAIHGMVQDPALRAVLAGRYGNYGLPPGRSSFVADALVSAHYLNGGSFPTLGSDAVSAAMVRTIEEFGGQVVTKADVQKIVVRGGRASGVLLSDGSTIEAPVIVSSVGAENTYGGLLEDVAEVASLRTRVENIQPSTGHLCLYLGIRGQPSDFGLKTQNLWLLPGLNHDRQFEAFESDSSAPFPGVYISAPKVVSRPHPDGEPRFTLEAIVPAAFKEFEHWKNARVAKRGEDYVQLKDALRTRLFDVVKARIPGLDTKVETTEFSTPLSTSFYTRHARGQMYGLEGSPARYDSRAIGFRTPIRGVYMAGQDAFLPGVSGALLSSVLVSSLLLRKNLTRTVADR